MGEQVRRQNYFFEECQVADYTRQQKTCHDINSLPTEERQSVKEDIQQNYKKYSKVYLAVMFDNSLLKGEIADPSFKYKTQASQEAFHAARTRSLQKILVVSGSANKVLETRKFAAELEQNKQDLANLKLSRQQLADKIRSEKLAQEEAAKAYSCMQEIANYLKSLCEFNPTAFVQWVGTINLYRLSWTFSRISWKTMWLYLQQLGILSSNSKLHGVPINITIMDAPTSVFNFLSVYIFFAKLAVNISLPFKHAFAPTYVAEEGLSKSERFWMEIKREWVNFFNDGWWIALNAITNYPKIFGISIPIAGWILTGALFFDVGLLLIVSRHEEAKIAAKIKWLEERIADHRNSVILNEHLSLREINNILDISISNQQRRDEQTKINANISEKANKLLNDKLKNRSLNIAETIKIIDEELPEVNYTELRIKIEILLSIRTTSRTEQDALDSKIQEVQEQLDEYTQELNTHLDVFKAMKDQAKIQRSGFRALIGLLVFATVMFIASLALTLSIASPIVAPIGFFVCIVAVALILSREEFSAIAEIRSAKNIKMDQDKSLEYTESQAVKAERNAMEHKAWIKFGKTFAEHVFVPMLIIGLYTISWPLAVVFTVTYVIYKCLQASKNTPKQTNDPGTSVTNTPSSMMAMVPAANM